MLNNISIQGRLTHQPEVKQSKNGLNYCRFTIASDRSIKEKDGTRKADFVECIAWKQGAEFVAHYFNKGDMIIINGSLRTENYTTEAGEKRKSYTVVANDVSFGGSKTETAPAASAPAQASATEATELPFEI